MQGVQLIISHNHAGLKTAIQAVFPSVKSQRWLFHLVQNAAAHALNISLRKELCQSVKDIYQGLDKPDAKNRLKITLQRYKNKPSKFCDWVKENFSEHWRKIRTTNVVERMN